MFKNKVLIYPIIILIGLALAGIIFQYQTEQEEQQTIKIVISNSKTSLPNFLLFMAKDAGFFSERNLNVEFERLSPAISVQALMAKEVDYLSYAKEGTMASQKGLPVKTVMLFSEQPGYHLVSRPETEIKDIKSIGIPAWLSPIHYEALKLIDEHNLSAEIISLRDGNARLTLMINGKLDASIHPLPTTLIMQRIEKLKILKKCEGEMAIGLVTSDEKIENNPDEVKNVIEAMLAAMEYFKANPQEAKELLFKFYGYEESEAYQKIMEDIYTASVDMVLEKGLPKGEGINNAVQMAKAGNFETLEDIKTQKVAPEDIAKSFDFRFLK